MKKNLVLLPFLIFGFLVIFYHEAIVEKIDEIISPADTRTTIAKIETFNGKVRFKKAQSLRYKNVQISTELKDQDTLTTDENSTAKVSFVSGFEIEVQPNSLVVIETPKKDASGAIQITFLKGEFTVLKTAAAGKIIVNKNNTFQDLAGRTPQKPVQIDLTTPIDLIENIKVQEIVQAPVQKQKLEEKKKIVVEEEKKAPPKKPRETLSDEYIAQIVNSQKPFFNRCYAQHLRLRPDSRGQIHLAFTIDIEGKVSSVSLVNSTMADPALEKCTMSVLERCRFRKFDGDPIVVNYPINFE